MRGRLTANEWVAYMATQFVAAALAGLVVRVVGGHEPHANVVGAGRMLIAEFLFTFALVWVVLNVATSQGTERNSFSARWSAGCFNGATSLTRSSLNCGEGNVLTGLRQAN